ncbi:MAG: hypothetical protein WCJ51_03665 [Candidatus Moraniibacteriota bacterium]
MKRYAYILKITSVILTTIVLTSVLVWNHNKTLQWSENRQKITTSFYEKFKLKDHIPAGSIFILKNENKIMLFVSEREHLKTDSLSGNNADITELDNIKEFYPPNVIGQKLTERRFLLDQFIQGKALKKDWRKQIEQ